MYDSVIYFVAEETSVDKYGDIVTEETQRMVFAELKSITQTEFYQAQAAGFKPEIKFVIADYLDYRGEKKVLYQPFDGSMEAYSVIRTYRNGNALEIVCNRGVDDGAAA